jgi:hypothetical protein
MKTRNTKKRDRNEALRAEFKRETGVKHLRTNYVITTLAKKYFLTEKTVEQIVYEVGHYNELHPPTGGDQLSLF